ncbi:hypothetical protein AXG93_1480s1020 [Marchantia polymorpha subsp. ruderalis]|uniref:Uncharacterized protein n=1 Tax=Marchantia polymorpha subsp. ruderalis TaxID=1480154 RepID=A0A176VZ49_MARPO|nr:hypothetical protein AXG93_1480s1020 [Marchantia polymorpha subsp. ruderalis]
MGAGTLRGGREAKSRRRNWGLSGRFWYSETYIWSTENSALSLQMLVSKQQTVPLEKPKFCILIWSTVAVPESRGFASGSDLEFQSKDTASLKKNPPSELQ